MPTIPDGKYIAGDEFIVIESSKISFHLKLQDTASNVSWEKKLNYNITPKKEITAYTMASSEYFKTLHRYCLYWDGESILKVPRVEKGEVVIFKKLNGAWPHSSEEDEVRKSENDGENGR